MKSTNTTKSIAWIFAFEFSAPFYLPEETCSQQSWIFCGGRRYYSQVVLGSSNQRKLPASLSLFLKHEKIPLL
jgi:hypothetical protein